MTIMIEPTASTHFVIGLDLDTTKFEAFLHVVRDKYPIMDYYIDSSVVCDRIAMDNIINIADGLYAHCEFEWSEYFYRALLKKCVQLYGEKSYESTVCMNKLATILSHNYTVNFVEIEYFLTAVGVYQVTNFGKTPDTILTFFKLINLNILMENYSPVKKMMNYIMSIHHKVVGFDYTALNQILIFLGNKLYYKGNKVMAKKCYLQALDIQKTKGVSVDNIDPNALNDVLSISS